MPTKAELIASLGERDLQIVELKARNEVLITDFNEITDKLDDQMVQAQPQMNPEDVPIVDCKCRLCNATREHGKLINQGRMNADQLVACGI